MHVIADFCLTPVGTKDVSTAKYIAECHKQLADSELVFKMHASGTNIEGDWDAVMKTIKNCLEAVMKMDGGTRVVSDVRIDCRTDKVAHLEGCTEKVEQLAQQHQ
ncbi:hypothetical protein HDV00_006924 [Rhizophlyctis rosea]|nr:hypothetical protein HDV00_006924 [Rhizophlyctis rosea]